MSFFYKREITFEIFVIYKVGSKSAPYRFFASPPHRVLPPIFPLDIAWGKVETLYLPDKDFMVSYFSANFIFNPYKT